MHLLVEKGNNPNNKKTPMGQILVSSAPILDWDSLPGTYIFLSPSLFSGVLHIKAVADGSGVLVG